VDPHDDIIEIVVLENGVEIKNTLPSQGGPVNQGTSFTMKPPDPTVTWARNNGASGGGECKDCSYGID